MRIAAIVVGILLLLPGACFSILGFAIGPRDGPQFLAIGALIIVAAIGLFFVASRLPRK